MRRIILVLIVLALCVQLRPQETFLFARKDTCSLFLDIHRPAGDLQKPTILYVFGGGFLMGARNEAYILPWFSNFSCTCQNFVVPLQP